MQAETADLRTGGYEADSEPQIALRSPIKETHMAVIRDVMPAFELFQPASIDDALALLDQHGADAWVMAGGLDSFDWLKDRTQAAEGRRRSEPDRGAARDQGGQRRPRDRRDDARSPRSCSIRWCARSSALLTEAAELVASPQIRNQGTHRRQRLAGHALLVLPQRLVVLPRGRQHLLRRHADGDQPRARDPRRRPLRGGEPVGHGAGAHRAGCADGDPRREGRARRHGRGLLRSARASTSRG